MKLLMAIMMFGVFLLLVHTYKHLDESTVGHKIIVHRAGSLDHRGVAAPQMEEFENQVE